VAGEYCRDVIRLHAKERIGTGIPMQDPASPDTSRMRMLRATLGAECGPRFDGH
jgi:hypothetical protein